MPIVSDWLTGLRMEIAFTRAHPADRPKRPHPHRWTASPALLVPMYRDTIPNAQSLYYLLLMRGKSNNGKEDFDFELDEFG